MKKRRIIRILLVVLSMVCGRMSASAQIKDGDIVTISYLYNQTTPRYMAAVYKNNSYVVAHSEEKNDFCYWIVRINNTGQWSFTNVGMINIENRTDTCLHMSGSSYPSAFLDNSGSLFTFVGTNSGKSAMGELYYTNGCRLYQYTYGTYTTWYADTDDRNYVTNLIIEKIGDDGGDEGGNLTGEFEPKSETFGFAKTAAEAEIKDNITFTINQKGTIDLSSISFAWQSSGTKSSKTICSNVEDDVVKERELLSLNWVKTADNTWNITVRAVGSSPMNLKDANDKWIDYTDYIVATFLDTKDSTHRVRIPVVRESYHKVEWPRFVASASPTNYTYNRPGGQATFNLSCIHKKGVDFIKSDGKTKAGNIVQVAETNVTAATQITFKAKSVVDETEVDWLTVESINDGKLTVSATDNSQNGVKRYARLVGEFSYTDPNDATDTHTATVEIAITQNAKDGDIVFLPQMGYANTEFGKNPIRQTDEQAVHTAEKTIYYLPDEDITLRIAERSFNAYYRWYDYETRGNPQYNAVESDRTSWATQPTGTLINNTNGDTYGIYREVVNNSEEVVGDVPVIKGWADGKAHIIACDVSNYKDYKISADTIIEPTLSYRQLFHLRPAQEMAERFKAAAAKKEFLETHYYTAPINQTIYLTTDYRYAGGDESDKSYYYYTNGIDDTGRYSCVGRDGKNAEWFEVDNNNNYTNITPNYYPAKDYLSRRESTPGTKIYELGVDENNNNMIDDGDVRIARFVVKYVDNCGPSNNPLITREKIVSDYVLYKEIDFSFGAPAPGNTVKFLNDHIPWEQASYGYTYPNINGIPDRNRKSGGSKYIPYYGEYFLTNKVDNTTMSWVNPTENHGGMENGYALYVDGTSEPGLVASISTNATICSGQTMYCSMWLSNVAINGTNPVFRCNIQGRNEGDTEWTDVGVFFVGEMGPSGGEWYQINFPVLSAEESYAETRVSVYNFATNASGNDFMIDDICLYASPLPLATYHETTGCTSYADSETTNTMVVVRIDYSQLHELGTNVYYQIVDVTDTDSVIVELKDADGNSLYHHDAGDNNPEYGSIAIPETIPDELKFSSVDEFRDELLRTRALSSGKCFVQDAVSKKWFLYMVQIIPNGSGGDRNQYLDRDRSYILRVSYNADELDKVACVFTSPLYAKQDTYIELRNSDNDAMRLNSCLDELCANSFYFLDVKVANTMSATTGGALQMYEAPVHADWLKGFEEDDIYCDINTATPEEITAAETAFEDTYGYTRDEVKRAIVSMRRIDGENYQVDNADNLRVDTDNGRDFTADKLALIQDLCHRGLLILYQKTAMFYLGSNASARCWAFPVAENATITTVDGKEVTLQDCDEPKWIKISSAHSEYGINLSPILGNDQDEYQRLDIPTIRILEGTEEVAIPIKELLNKTQIFSSLKATKDTLRFNINSPIDQVLEYVDISNGDIDIVGAPTDFELGKEYMMRMAFYDKDGNIYINNDASLCRVGHVYFYLKMVPRLATWTGQKSHYWGVDANWDRGCAPMPETNVIIPSGTPTPIITDSNYYSMDVNYKPNVCNKIYFEYGAMVQNQHLLKYNRAFVDMKIGAANWNSMAPPMKNMYTGDMYVPHEGFDGQAISNMEFSSTNDNPEYPFIVNSFHGTRTSKAPYVFWQSLYNKRVTIYHENGNQSHPELTSTAIFAQTNSLGQPLPVGSGYQVLGFGPNQDDKDEIIVRLPKPDSYYSYYYKDGRESDQRVAVTHSSELAFEPNAQGNMSITLKNDIASNQFMFGNPTMANIDMKKFLEANSNILAKKFYIMDDSQWSAENWYTIAGDPIAGLLAPMRSVLLELKEGTSTSITVTLSADHLEGAMSKSQPAAIAPRKIAASEASETQLMTIYASSDNGKARCILASDPYALDTYDSDEDALLISSGVEDGVNSATATSPINMYTVSEQVPMMVDVRENIDTVPLSMLVHDSYRTEKVQFAFYLSLNWDKECYFCDAVTGKRYRIMDGLWLEMDMPTNHEVRYYIEGPDRVSNSDVTTSTTHPNAEKTENKIWAYSPDNGTLTVASNDILKLVNIYDLSGRIIAQQSLDLQYNSATIHVPAGVYIVEATMRDNSKEFTQAIVW